eukprot:COSAG04_NODE_11046_length_734_cov_1.143307_1_plen_110_part_00
MVAYVDLVASQVDHTLGKAREYLGEKLIVERICGAATLTLRCGIAENFGGLQAAALVTSSIACCCPSAATGQAMKASAGAPRAQTSACPGKLRKQLTAPVLRLSKLTRR